MDFQNWIRSYVIQVIPLISFVVYILGFSFYIAYYSVFGINIISYITLSEVLVSAFAPIVICVATGLIWNLVGPIYFRAFKPYLINAMSKIFPKRYGKGLIGNKSTCRKLKTIFPFLRSRAITSLFGSVFILLFLIFYISEIEQDSYTKHICLIFFVVAIGLYEVSCLQYYQKIRLTRVRTVCYTRAWSIMGLGLFSALIFWGINEGKAVMQSEPDFFEVVVTNGSIYQSPQYTYIGDTSTATFLLQRNTGNYLVINNENIISTLKRRSSSINHLLHSNPPEKSDFNLRNGTP